MYIVTIFYLTFVMAMKQYNALFEVYSLAELLFTAPNDTINIFVALMM